MQTNRKCDCSMQYRYLESLVKILPQNKTSLRIQQRTKMYSIITKMTHSRNTMLVQMTIEFNYLDIKSYNSLYLVIFQQPILIKNKTNKQNLKNCFTM
jgi:hypothetical protein